MLTRQSLWNPTGARVFTDLSLAQAALQREHPAKELWVIGGAEVYAQAMAYAQRIELTLIEKNYEGDALAPKIDANWATISKETHSTPSGLVYHFISYQRTPLRSDHVR